MYYCGTIQPWKNKYDYFVGTSKRLKFENIYVYSKSLYQPKYVHLEALLKSIKDIQYFSFNASEYKMHPSGARPSGIFIFDDA